MCGLPRSLLPGLLLALLSAAGGAESAAAGGAAEAAVSECVRQAAERLQERYESVTDLRARFEQESRSVALGGAGGSALSKGRVVFAKPGKMRWSYTEPEESLVVSDGRWLWIYDVAAGEAQRYPVAGGWLSAAAVQFLLGEGDLLRDFRVESRSCDEREAHLVLHPRSPAAYETLTIVADARSGDLRETEVVDLVGNTTRVTFLDVEVNVDPEPELFRFEAPPGVEVTEIHAPEPTP